MLRAIQPLTRTELDGDGEGQSCALIIAQPPTDPGGWLVELHAESSQGFFLVKRFLLTRPLRGPSRVVATCTFPRARRWRASVYSPAAASWGASAVTAIAGALSVSNEPYSLGESEQGQPGARGWSYATAAGAAAVTLPAGAQIREISAIGDPAGGAIVVEVWRDAVTVEALPSIPLPAAPAPGILFKLPKEDLAGAWVRRVIFTNTVSYFVAWVE